MSVPPAVVPALESLGPRFADFVARLSRPILFFDLETTGTDPVRDRIIELSAIRICPPPTGIEAPRTWRIDPQTTIPRESQEIHGISDADLAGAPTFAQVADELLALFSGADLGGFGITRLDVRMLQAEFARAGKTFDASAARLVDAQVVFHRREPRDLSAALQFYRAKSLEGAHGAEADAIASLEVFAGQLARYEDLEVELDALHELSSAFGAQYVDGARRFLWRDDEPVFNFGKLRGKSLRWAAAEPSERDYLRWILSGAFEEDTKAIVREALAGRIRRRDER